MKMETGKTAQWLLELAAVAEDLRGDSGISVISLPEDLTPFLASTSARHTDSSHTHSHTRMHVQANVYIIN